MLKRTLSITGVSLVVLLSLTACFGGGNNDEVKPTQEPTTTEQTQAPEETEAPAAPTEVDGELVGSATTAEGLKIDVYSVGEQKSTEDSGYVYEDGTDGYPAGSDVELLVYSITNTGTADVDIYGVSTATSKYYASGYYAYNDFDAADAVEAAGYPTDLYDIYGFDAETWPLAPGDTVIYGEGWYHDSVRDGDLTVEFSAIGWADDAEVVITFK